MLNSKDPNLLFPYVKYLHDLCWTAWLAAGLHPTDTSTVRDNEYQDYLYAIGRTTKGTICTYLKGGHSMHNYRLAFDCDFPSDAEHHKAGVIGKSLGLVWGGDFHLKNGDDFVDHPHFEWTGGLDIDDLLAGKVPVDPRKGDTMIDWNAENKKIVMKMQKATGLLEDGEGGVKTSAKLDELLKLPAENAKLKDKLNQIDKILKG